MILNRYEYSKVSNRKLPPSWQSQERLDELEQFLQSNWEQRSVFYNDEEVNTRQQFLEFLGNKSIKTKKYIGTIVFKGEQFNIFPKMFSTDPDDTETDELDTAHLLKNLVNWVQYCNRFQYPFLNISTEYEDSTDLKDLFVTLYISYIKSAISRGLYYEYVDETNARNSIKGRIDFSDYIINRISRGNANKFQCTYSNFKCDNDVNRIIKYTCKQLYNQTSKKNQKSIRTIFTRLNEVSDFNYSPHDCDKIRLNKLHKNYEIIISMSKMFLLNKVSNYNIDTNESFCFLFPTDLLFEGFIGGFLKDVIEEYGGNVKLQEGKYSLIDSIIYKGNVSGPAFKMRHDIVVDLHNQLYILDTKYKGISRFEDNEDIAKTINEEIHQNDMYQILEYSRKRGIQDVYLLYPMYRYENEEYEFPVGISTDPSGNKINVHFIRMPFIFEEDINDTVNQLRRVVKRIFCISD